MHSKNIIHGDIKGANILLSKNGEVKLCDFGISKVVSSRSSILKTSESFSGTVSFSPPELFRENNAYSFPIDIWAFGCTVIEMSTRSSPFQKNVLMPYEKHSSEDLENIYNKRVSQARCIPEEESINFKSDVTNIFALARTCLRPETEKRPTIEELLERSFFTGTVNDLKRLPLSLNPRYNRDIKDLVEEAKLAEELSKSKTIDDDYRAAASVCESVSIDLEDRFGFVHY